MSEAVETRKVIHRNSARCTKCKDEIESKHRHDFVSCSCDAIFVDGGRAYLRHGYHVASDIEDTSIVEVVNV